MHRFSWVLFLAAAAASPGVKIRPLTVQVIDGTTNQPISGLVVYYGITTVQPRHILWFRVLDNPRYPSIDCRALTTDQRGTVTIERRKVRLRWDESLGYEEMLINLDSRSLQEGAMRWGRATPDLHSPSAAYCAAEIQIAFGDSEGLTGVERRQEKLGLIPCEVITLDAASERKESERIVVELKRRTD